jgi:hypothetical protein
VPKGPVEGEFVVNGFQANSSSSPFLVSRKRATVPTMDMLRVEIEMTLTSTFLAFCQITLPIDKGILQCVVGFAILFVLSRVDVR